MLEHPWIELQVLIKEKWLTQKAFASILWKKVSEVNELLKWKRNITIQRDYLLHQTLWTPIKYWILKQIDYDYSLLDIEETDDLSFWTDWKILGNNEQNTQDSSSQTPQNNNITQTSHSEHSEESIGANTSFWTEWRILDDNKQDTQQPLSPATQSSSPNREQKPKNDIFSPRDWKSHKSPLPGGDLEGAMGSNKAEGVITQKTPTKEQESKNDEDLKNRAKIFRTF